MYNISFRTADDRSVDDYSSRYVVAAISEAKATDILQSMALFAVHAVRNDFFGLGDMNCTFLFSARQFSLTWHSWGLSFARQG